MTICELERCIDVYGKGIYTFCRQLTGSTQEAEELYQDTFVKATELIEKLDMDRNVKSCLLSIAVGLWKNKKRKFAWRMRIVPMESLNEETAEEIGGADRDTVEGPILSQEVAKRVRQAVGKLNDKYRIPILMYYTEEMSVKAIGEILNLPEGTVKSRLHKARKILRLELEVVSDEK